MLYTEKEKHEIERVKEVFAEHLRQSPDFELLWSDKVGYVWLTIGVNPLYVDTGIRIESAADLCYKCLDDVAMDVLYMTGKDNADTIIGNMDTSIFLGGKEPTTLKELAAVLGKETIDTYNTGESRGRETSHSLNYQKLGKDMPYLFVKSSVALNLS